MNKGCEKGGTGEFALFEAPEGYLLAIRCSHHFLDAWGAYQLFMLICETYERFSGTTAQIVLKENRFLPALQEDQIYRLCGEEDHDLRYWRETLEGCAGQPLIMHLADHPVALAKPSPIKTLRCQLPPDLVGRLRQNSRALGVTFDTFLSAMVRLYLAKMSGRQSIITAETALNRTRRQLRILGHFSNMVPLQTYIEEQKSVTQFLQTAAQQQRQAHKHGRVPFGRVLRECGLQRAHGDVRVNILLSRKGPSLNGQAIRARTITGQHSKFSISLWQLHYDMPLEVLLDYDIGLFEERTIKVHQSRLLNFFDKVTKDLNLPVSSLSVCDIAEYHLVTSTFNDTQVDYLKGVSILDHFKSQVQIHPDSTAVIDDRKSLTYRELDRRSNRLARYLIAQGVGPEQVVGVCLERSVELVFALLAILKAGGGYLFLAPDYPLERFTFMLEDAECGLVIRHKAVGPPIHSIDPQSRFHQIFLDDGKCLSELTSYSCASLKPSERNGLLTQNSLAYVIYTSGSSGKPKGVMVGHREITNRLAWMQEYMPLGPQDTLLQKTPCTFDVSVWELLWWAVAGARVVMLTPGATGILMHCFRLL
nr:AMP-binding protein [Pseudovibrio sp. M1P-2-3]